MVFTQRPGNQFQNRPGEIHTPPSQKNGQSRAMTGPIHTPTHHPHNPYMSQNQNPYQQFQHTFQPGQQFPRESFEHQQIPENKLNATDLKGLSFWHGENESTYQDNAEEESTTNSALKFVVAIVSIVILSSLVWLTYRWATHSHSGSVPFIKAEQGPYKTQPENPGGANFPHQEMLVYGRLSPQQFHNDQQNIEHVMPQQDDYHTREVIQNPPPHAQYAAPNSQPYYQQNYSSQNGHALQPPQQHQTQPVYTEQPHATVNTGYNQNVHIVPNQSNQEQYQQNRENNFSQHPIISQQVPYQQIQTPQVQQENIPQNQQDPIKTVLGEPQPKNIEQDIPLSVEIPTSKKQASPIDEESIKNISLKKEDTSSARIVKGTFFIQLGTLPTAKSAKNEWERIKKNHPAEFKDLNPSIKLAEIGVKKMYRIIVGPFQDRNIALKKCLKVGHGCKVIQEKTAH